MNKKIAASVGTIAVLASMTAVIARTGFFSQSAPSVCVADSTRESSDRATLLSDKQLAISANQLTVVNSGRVLDPQSCVATDGMLRHLSVLPGTGAAFVVDQAGQDVLTLVSNDETIPVASGLEITHPAWSPTGQLAWAENLEVLKVMSSDGAEVSGVVLPKGAVAAFSPVFLNEQHVMAVVQEQVAGAPPEDESLNNLWRFDLSSGRWTRLTSFNASGDDWIGIRTPVVAPDGSIYFVRISANASETKEPRFELWRFSDGSAEKIRALASEMYLAGLSDDRLVWNAPSRTCGDWGLFLEQGGGLDQIGCGAVMTDPVTMADPDQLVESEHAAEEVAPESGDLTDLVIVVGDFRTSDAASEVASGLGRPARVIGHEGAPSALRPGLWGVLVEVTPGIPVDEDLEDVRQQLSGCDCGAWLAPSI
jgi:hypothetical protein